MAPAADLSVRVDAREVARQRVPTDLRLTAHECPLTLVFPKWIPGEHGRTGPLESIIGLVIRANGAPLPWRRDPREYFDGVRYPHLERFDARPDTLVQVLKARTE
ncbi:MAG TPA: hypothetical protein VGD47_05740 [Steroidobacteraceae bacterium]